MKNIIILLMISLGINAYGCAPGPSHKYTIIWIPEEKGTSLVKIQDNKKFLKLKNKFKKRYPEYTLIFNEDGMLIKMSAPLAKGTSNINEIFKEFEELFEIPRDARDEDNLYSYKSYKGLPLIPPYSVFTEKIFKTFKDPLDANKGTWSLTLEYDNRIYQLKYLDLTPTITGTQAIEIAAKEVYDFSTWPDPTYQSEFPTLKEYINKYAQGGFSEDFLKKWYEPDKTLYENKRAYYKNKGIIPQPPSISPVNLPELRILFHNDNKPYLAWYVAVKKEGEEIPWICYVDAKRGRILDGYVNIFW